MATRQITEGYFLCIDTATPTVQVGIFGAGSWQCLFTSIEEALQSLFSLVQRCLSTVGLKRLQELKGVYFCNGPGSVLSLRITLTALRAWMLLEELPVYSYTSLAFGYAVALQNAAKYPFYVVAPGRHGSWYTLEAKGANDCYYHSVKTLEFPGQCYLIPQRKYTLAVPPESLFLNYLLEQMPQFFVNGSHFKPTITPKLFQLPTTFIPSNL